MSETFTRKQVQDAVRKGKEDLLFAQATISARPVGYISPATLTALTSDANGGNGGAGPICEIPLFDTNIPVFLAATPTASELAMREALNIALGSLKALGAENGYAAEAIRAALAEERKTDE